jgi:hypothetical protein
MPYLIKKEINIRNDTDDFDYTITADEYGTVLLSSSEGLEAMTGKTDLLYIPKDCIQHIIDALEQFK